MVCDLAETYGILNYRTIEGRTLATLVAGLRPSSRVGMAISGQKWPLETLLLARIYDLAALEYWTKTKDGEKNRNRPQSVVELMTGEQKSQPVLAFSSGADFEAARRKLLEAM